MNDLWNVSLCVCVMSSVVCVNVKVCRCFCERLLLLRVFVCVQEYHVYV